ncbi:MAG: nucleotidyltransferase domain-containing protein [Thermoprotei archaeon]
MNSIREFFESEKDVLLAIIFGSFVELKSFRDVDIAIYSMNKEFKYYALLSARLEEFLRIPFDVVPIDELQVKFRYNVLTKGIIILERVAGLYEALFNQTIDELTLLSLSM